MLLCFYRFMSWHIGQQDLTGILVQEHCVVHEIGSPTDYRRLTAVSSS